MSALTKILAIAVACSAVTVSAESAGRYKKIKNTSQDGHNDLKMFFQENPWDNDFLWDDHHWPAMRNGATLCVEQCTDHDWCMSCDYQRIRGECNLSKTRIGDEDGGIAKYDPNADYYEWIDFVEHHR